MMQNAVKYALIFDEIFVSCWVLFCLALKHIRYASDRVMAKGDGREVGFQDGGYFSRFLKRERISNQTFIAFLNRG